MNIAKNMEIIFVAATLVLGLSSEAVARSTPRPVATLEQPAYTPAAEVARVPVVIVSAKRLTAAEKAAIAG